MNICVHVHVYVYVWSFKCVILEAAEDAAVVRRWIRQHRSSRRGSSWGMAEPGLGSCGGSSWPRGKGQGLGRLGSGVECSLITFFFSWFLNNFSEFQGVEQGIIHGRLDRYIYTINVSIMDPFTYEWNLCLASIRGTNALSHFGMMWVYVQKRHQCTRNVDMFSVKTSIFCGPLKKRRRTPSRSRPTDQPIIN